MSRRRKSRASFPWVMVLCVILLAGGGSWFLVRESAEGSFRTVEVLDSALYYGNANALRGNTYRIDAEIDSALGNSPSRGRLFSVVLKDGSKSGAAAILPVLVPPSLGSLTIQKGQHYLMKVKVIEGGLLEVREARKP